MKTHYYCFSYSKTSPKLYNIISIFLSTIYSIVPIKEYIKNTQKNILLENIKYRTGVLLKIFLMF